MEENKRNQVFDAPIEKRPTLIKIGNKFKVEIFSMSHDGMGITKISGETVEGTPLINYPVFVNGMISGEQGIIELLEMRKNFGIANVAKLFTDLPTPMRVKPACIHFPDCGGCNIMHMNYESQLLFKKSVIRQTFKRVAGIDKVNIKDPLGMNNPFNYRNKVQVPFGQVRGKTVCGFYRSSSHEIISISECPIQSEEMTEITKFVRNVASEFNLFGYDESTNRGELRHILIRESLTHDEVMIVLVCMKDVSSRLNELCMKIVKRHPRVKSIILNINPNLKNTILGEKNITLFGKDYIEDDLLGYTFKISAKSFYQVNNKQTEILYNEIIKIGKFKPTDIVIDAYSGIGTIGIIVSKYVKKVFGVEIVPDAIKDAIINAERNQIQNIEFINNKAEKQLSIWLNDGIKPDVIIVDPPRKGIDESLLQAVVEHQIPKMIYVSCNPATLARDVKYLVENGYEIKIVQPVDMFPQTIHVENLVCLTRK